MPGGGSVPTLRQEMTPAPWFIDVRAGIGRARALMEKHGVHHLPVVDGPKLLGVVSEADLRRLRVLQEGFVSDEELSVGDAMVERAAMVDVTTPLAAVLERMGRERLEAALVLRAGALVGIFTVSDACRLLARELRTRRGAERPAPGPPRPGGGG